MEALIEYRVSAENVEAQEAAVRAFVTAVKASNDPGFRYASYKRPDGVSFVHHAWFADEEVRNRFQALSEFKGFAEGLKARSVDGPTVSSLDLVSSSIE